MENTDVGLIDFWVAFGNGETEAHSSAWQGSGGHCESAVPITLSAWLSQSLKSFTTKPGTGYPYPKPEYSHDHPISFGSSLWKAVLPHSGVWQEKLLLLLVNFPWALSAPVSARVSWVLPPVVWLSPGTCSTQNCVTCLESSLALPWNIPGHPQNLPKVASGSYSCTWNHLLHHAVPH